MESIQTLVKCISAIEGHVIEMKAELQIAEDKGVFSYPRSKEIRKAALGVANTAAEIRRECLDIIKGELKI